MGLAISAFAQEKVPWTCADEVALEGAAGLPAAQPYRIRVSTGVSARVVQSKVLPDISDLKGEDIDAKVEVGVVIDREGNVRCTRLEKGESDLVQRSMDAAKKWTFMPYQLNGHALTVETFIEFTYTKDNVEAR